MVIVVASSMVAMTGFLQSTAPWWKGPAAALALFWLGKFAIFLSAGDGEADTNGQIMALAETARFCGFLIFLGSIGAILLRDNLSPRKLAFTLFVGAYVLLWFFVFRSALS